ncbi:hypothetical protein [Streptomyces humi]
MRDDEGERCLSFAAVPMARITERINRAGYRVTGAWSAYRAGDVVRRVRVEPVPAAVGPHPRFPGVSAVEAWENDGGACVGVQLPRSAATAGCAQVRGGFTTL